MAAIPPPERPPEFDFTAALGVSVIAFLKPSMSASSTPFAESVAVAASSTPAAGAALVLNLTAGVFRAQKSPEI